MNVTDAAVYPYTPDLYPTAVRPAASRTLEDIQAEEPGAEGRTRV